MKSAPEDRQWSDIRALGTDCSDAAAANQAESSRSCRDAQSVGPFTMSVVSGKPPHQGSETWASRHEALAAWLLEQWRRESLRPPGYEA
jgi:hypothetical protein